MKRIRFFTVIFFLVQATQFLCSVEQAPSSYPEIHAISGILMDATTGTVLFEKNTDLTIPPASLTKLMTMYVVFKEIQEGRVSLTDQVPIPPESWAINQPPGSSLMFLGPGQRVTLHELLLGLAVCSGNDAAVAIALYIAPTIQDFTERMNSTAKSLGLYHTYFVEPSGISEYNQTTARDFALFCKQYISEFPRALTEYHSVREFTYPKAENLQLNSNNEQTPVIQKNRNFLLDAIDGVDGLKTGFIDEAGYNLAVTAEREGTRLLAVLLGGPGNSSQEGDRFRTEDGRRILEWGFCMFQTIHPSIAHLEPIRIWKGVKNTLSIEAGGNLAFTVPKERATGIQYKVVHYDPVIAPVVKGDSVGEIVFFDNSGELHHVSLLAQESIAQGNIFKRIFDTIVLAFESLFAFFNKG